MKFDITHLWTLVCGLATGGALNPIVQKALKWLGFGKKENSSIGKVYEKLDEHAKDDNDRFDKIKDFIRESEDRTIQAFNGGVGRLENQISEQTKRTDQRFETLEKTHQNLLFRYFDLVDKKKVQPPATGTEG